VEILPLRPKLNVSRAHCLARFGVIDRGTCRRLQCRYKCDCFGIASDRVHGGCGAPLQLQCCCTYATLDP